MRILWPLARLKVTRVSGTEYIPKTSPVIFAANHVGFFDGPAMAVTIYRVRPEITHFLTYDLMWKAWGGPFATRLMGMIRLDLQAKADSLGQMVAVLKQGKIASIFPEGQRNFHPERLQPGKTGAVRMALASGASIIPVGIRNSTGRTIGKAFASFLNPQKQIQITFGPPVDLSAFRDQEITRELLHAATRRLMSAIGKAAGVPAAHE